MPGDWSLRAESKNTSQILLAQTTSEANYSEAGDFRVRCHKVMLKIKFIWLCLKCNNQTAWLKVALVAREGGLMLSRLKFSTGGSSQSNNSSKLSMLALWIGSGHALCSEVD
jgi:hypothetical protein